jgi:hypothetical protein
MAAEEVAMTFAANAMEGRLMTGKAVGAVGLHGVRGIIHSPIHVHLCPHTMVWPQYTIVHPIFVKVMVHPALYIVLMERSECKARPGMM